MPPVLLEVIVQTLDDARAATDGGADRLEVVRAIRDGGLTPPRPLVEAIRAATPLPLRVMVRGNAGYRTDPEELRRLQRAAAGFAALGVDGLVAGFAAGGEILIDEFAALCGAAPEARVTFHRAFDTLADPLGAIDRVAAVARVDGILTSGGEGDAAARCARLRAYASRAGQRLSILAGGGVDEQAFGLFAASGCVRQIHVGRAARDGDDPEGPVSAARVRRLRDLADRPPDA